MNLPRHRPLSVGPIRAFEAVARLLSFRAAADELHLTQSAISRQIRSLEEEVGVVLFQRGTRHVELTGDGAVLLRAVIPALERLDTGVRQIRSARGRKIVSVTTFASFSSLWLIPRLEAFQRLHPDIDIRISATDSLIDLDEPDIDLALRYCTPEQAPPNAERMFGETLTPAISPWLAEQIRSGRAPPLAQTADLAGHTLAEEDNSLASTDYVSWRHWLRLHGHAALQPRRWLYFNFTYQQVQAALAGQAVTLARVALVAEHFARGELIEPFGASARIDSPYAYWLITSPQGSARAEVAQFTQWVLAQAELTRRAIGECAAASSPISSTPHLAP
jgi:LysR family glycine cleavage system transcriptional activator